MIVQTAAEVLRGGKEGDRHWIPDGQWVDYGALGSTTSCGLSAVGMVTDQIKNPRRLTCFECRTNFGAHYLASDKGE